MKTHINGNTIEQLMTNVVTLTQSQYDALPLEQKNHGTYIISDSTCPNINAEDVDYSTGVSVKDKIDEVDDKLTGKVLSGGIANSETKTLDVIEGVGVIFIYRSSTGLFAMLTQYNTTFTTVAGQLPNTITIGYANNKITITNTVGYTIGYSIINNPWAL